MGDGSPTPGLLLWGTPYPQRIAAASQWGELKIPAGLIYLWYFVLEGQRAIVVDSQPVILTAFLVVSLFLLTLTRPKPEEIKPGETDHDKSNTKKLNQKKLLR